MFHTNFVLSVRTLCYSVHTQWTKKDNKSGNINNSCLTGSQLLIRIFLLLGKIFLQTLSTRTFDSLMLPLSRIIIKSYLKLSLRLDFYSIWTIKLAQE